MTTLMTKLMSAPLDHDVECGCCIACNSRHRRCQKHHHNNDNQYNGASPHFVVSGQPANKKRLLRDRKDKKEAKRKKQHCKTTPEKPVADANPKTITISNGVTTYTLPFDPRFSVEVAKPGSITVHSGDRTVTLPGASITVHRQIMSKSLVERAGLQAIVNSHGDTVFAIKPAGNTPVQDTGLGAQLKGVAKDIGNGLENLGVGLHRYRRTDSTGAENRDDHSGIDLDIIRRASVHDRTGNGCHIDRHREYRQLKAIILAPASF
jgi:hypothetical protein